MAARRSPHLARSCCLAFALLSVGAGALAGEPLPLKGPLEVGETAPLIAPELPAALEEFAREAASLERKGAEFLGHYQRFIAALDAGIPRRARRTPQECAALPLWEPWLGARQSLDAYRRQARVARAAVRPIETYFKAGYAQGLTPQLRLGVEGAAARWVALADQQRSLEAMMRHQLTPEVRRAGCDPEQQVPVAVADAWDEEPTPPAPAVGPAAIQVAISAPQPPAEAPEPPPRAAWGQALAAPLPPEELAPPLMAAIPGISDDPLISSPLAATFIVDNSGCGRDLEVFVDGAPAGAVPAYTRSAFITEEGPHRLCVGPAESETCASPDESLGVIIYDGWALRPGC